MGIYYFAVDYNAKKQMWSPKNWSDKCIYFPTHPLPCMIVMKNLQGSDFQVIDDVSSYEEHEFLDVSEEVYEEFKNKFPAFDWKSYEE